MSPSTGVLMWMAQHARQLGIMVRQVEDEIGRNEHGHRGGPYRLPRRCAPLRAGFALMTEAVGMAGMLETPIVCVDVQRAGPATGVPTKTEQGDLWQVLGAGQGDYPRIIVARPISSTFSGPFRNCSICATDTSVPDWCWPTC